VSEAVTNAIIHGYDEKATSTVYVSCIIYRDGGEHVLQVVIEDTGKGIEDIKQAMEPMFTTRPELERSGMGFAFMNAFMDDVLVQSEIMKGTTVTLFKRLRRLEEHMNEEG
jgi:stage II sporulation protein AB (anti-sigma F factor)